MCSSARYSVSPFRVLIVTGTTSASKRPSSHARLARCWDWRAMVSTSSRVMSYCAASFSAVWAMVRPQFESRSACQRRSSKYWPASPRRSCPQRAPRTTWGAWLMDSVPPHSVTLDSSRRMSLAPWTMASKPEPHRRFTVRAPDSWGTPARSATWRAR